MNINTKVFKILLVILIIHSELACSYHSHEDPENIHDITWKQISYNFDGVMYRNDTDIASKPNIATEGVQEADKFFIQYNNVPIGMEVDGSRVFVTVPRRRHGIPSTINYISMTSSVLKPYPDVERNKEFVSVYRPRVDECGRLWFVDTGLLEIPGARKQVKKPTIYAINLRTNEVVLKYELKDSDLVNERTPGGLTSITVDVTPDTCDDAYAYINDLATEGMVVFSLKKRDSWRLNHESFRHEESALNFTVAGYAIPWKDGLFSIALSEPDSEGRRTAYYHPMMSTKEYAIATEVLKDKSSNTGEHVQLLGTKGPLTQSGSHGYHQDSHTLFFANLAQDAVLCWNVHTPLMEDNVAVVAQDSKELLYISDLKIVGDDVWTLVNQMPRFVYSSLDPNDVNFYIHRRKIRHLIENTVCDQSHHS